jgi:hypothetical protein
MTNLSTKLQIYPKPQPETLIIKLNLIHLHENSTITHIFKP